jgi:hypothetical protein
MKRCILGKTASFHAFHWTRREQGKKKHLSLAFLLSLSLSQYPKKPDKTPYMPEPEPMAYH